MVQIKQTTKPQWDRTLSAMTLARSLKLNKSDKIMGLTFVRAISCLGQIRTKKDQ